jgi:hypothetical protein
MKKDGEFKKIKIHITEARGSCKGMVGVRAKKVIRVYGSVILFFVH